MVDLEIPGIHPFGTCTWYTLDILKEAHVETCTCTPSAFSMEQNMLRAYSSDIKVDATRYRRMIG